jgi:hypothetical protein
MRRPEKGRAPGGLSGTPPAFAFRAGGDRIVALCHPSGPMPVAFRPDGDRHEARERNRPLPGAGAVSTCPRHCAKRQRDRLRHGPHARDEPAFGPLRPRGLRLRPARRDRRVFLNQGFVGRRGQLRVPALAARRRPGVLVAHPCSLGTRIRWRGAVDPGRGGRHVHGRERMGRHARWPSVVRRWQRTGALRQVCGRTAFRSIPVSCPRNMDPCPTSCRSTGSTSGSGRSR